MPQSVEEYLQREEVRERILNAIHSMRKGVTVTIGRVAELFSFTESQLRDWENRGLVRTIRTKGGRRHYSSEELDRLAIIRELLNAGYSPGDILAVKPGIKQYLQREEAGERVLRTIEKVRAEVMVTIGRAAELSGFSENRLRDWEDRGLISSERRGMESYSNIGHRNYPLKELNKLAIIRLLLDAGFSISDIPPDIGEFWPEIDEALSSFFSQTRELDNAATLQLRIMEEPLTTQNLIAILSSITELYRKSWLIVQGRLADLIEYAQTHDSHLIESADLIISKMSHNSPADINLNLGTDLNPQAIAEALKIGIDAITQTPLRREEAKLANEALALDVRLKEQNLQSTLADKEQTRQIEAQRAKLEKREKELELEAKQLEIQEKRLEIEKSRINYALETADKMINLLRPNADRETKGMLVRALLPDLLQLGNGKELELVNRKELEPAALPAHIIPEENNDII